MSTIKARCKPIDEGGCGNSFDLEAPDSLDEDGRGYALQMATWVGCPACSIYQGAIFKLEDVRDKNQSIIWDQERRRDNLARAVERGAGNRPELEEKITGIDRIISMARQDLVLALRHIAKLKEAREEQLLELKEVAHE